jgi:hypothetical protein
MQEEYSMGIMNNWTIGKRLTLGFAGVVLITVGVSIYAFTRLEAIQSQAAAWANDSFPGAVLMGQIAALSEWEVALVLQHIKANDAQEVQKLDDALRENHEKLGSLFKAYETTVFGAEETERFQRSAGAVDRIGAANCRFAASIKYCHGSIEFHCERLAH